MTESLQRALAYASVDQQILKEIRKTNEILERLYGALNQTKDISESTVIEVVQELIDEQETADDANQS